MVITGAGPGIMEAGIEGAGADHSFGVSIRLPFESTESQFLADDPKLINFRYFFTRKVAFIKEADGFVLLPGGYGTLDEAFELLTLVQTGKAQPGPIVLLDVPGGTYWQDWTAFVRKRAARARATCPSDDLALVLVTDDVSVAVEESSASSPTTTRSGSWAGRLVMRLLPRARRRGTRGAVRRVRRHHRAGTIERVETSAGRGHRRRLTRPPAPRVLVRSVRLVESAC